MKTIVYALCTLLTISNLNADDSTATKAHIENPNIDYDGFARIVIESAEDRDQKRLTEKEFHTAITSGEYILLDARSERTFKMRHIKGAVNLPFTEFSQETLAKVIPGEGAKILIYCNNNFAGSPEAMFSKSIRASLNLSTQASLRAYGYENIYELGPFLDVNNTILPFAGTEVTAKRMQQASAVSEP